MGRRKQVVPKKSDIADEENTHQDSGDNMIHTKIIFFLSFKILLRTFSFKSVFVQKTDKLWQPWIPNNRSPENLRY
jgi:hypothetical protein